MNIWFSSNENAHLSNLEFRPFVDKKGRQYVSVEHAYQTLKSGKLDEETFNLKWGKGRKFFGKKKANKSLNIEIMYKIMNASFQQNPMAMRNLLMTGDEILTHNQDNGIWRQKFPELLMKIRHENKEHTCNT